MFYEMFFGLIIVILLIALLGYRESANKADNDYCILGDKHDKLKIDYRALYKGYQTKLKEVETQNEELANKDRENKELKDHIDYLKKQVDEKRVNQMKKDLHELEKENKSLKEKMNKLEGEIRELEIRNEELSEGNDQELKQREYNLFGEVKQLSHLVFKVVGTDETYRLSEEFLKGNNNPIKEENGYEYYRVNGEEVAIPVTICDYLRDIQPTLFGLTRKGKSKYGEGAW